jgi:Sulfotransferase family
VSATRSEQLAALLDPGALMSEASAQTRLDDYGDRGFVEPLERWLEGMVIEARIHELGVELVRQNVLRLLVNRLRVEDDLRQHPEILAEDVSDPVIVTGLPRTGTTKLQRMLARHPRLRGIPLWWLLNPAPIPAPAGQPDPRRALGLAQSQMMAQQFPEFQAAHPMLPDEVDEEYFAMEMTFEAVNYWRGETPTFKKWMRSRPADGVYAYLHTLIQYFQWQHGGRDQARLVLKTPVHLGNLSYIRRWFPRAIVVHCHRDPRIAIVSSARLAELTQRLASDRVNRAAIGSDVLDYWSQAAAQNLLQRGAAATDLKIVDVRYEQIVSDPFDVIRTIMELAEQPFIAADGAALCAWEVENPPHRYGRHVYAAGDYGLSDERIEKAFASYLARFYPDQN